MPPTTAAPAIYEDPDEVYQSVQTPKVERDVEQDYASADTPQHARPALLSADNTHSVLRKWYAIRWHLARNVFAKPVPFLTDQFQLKRGDCFITLPLAVIFIAINAYFASSGDVGSSGSPPAIVMAIVFALAVRNNAILLTATGLPFERAILYHKFFGGVAWITSGLHGLAYLKNDKKKGDGAMPVQLSGAITFYALSALVVFAFEPIRRRFFDLFLRFHWVLFIVIVVFGVIHGAGVILIGFVPWLLDLLYRLAYRSPKWAREGGGITASDVRLKLVSKDVVRVQFLRPTTGPGFQYEAGQYAFLCIPSIARLEWHPFSISSAPHEKYVTFYVKCLGGWTKQLAALAAKHANEPTAVLVDGPYGSVAVEMEHYSHFAFFSGGIGVTPMRSLVNDLFYTSTIAKSRRCPVQKARFIWAGRERELLQTLVLDEARAIHTDDPAESWFPHVIASPSHANSLELDAFVADFYLTNKTQDLSDSVDQQLALCLNHQKRPDVEKILRELGEDAQRSLTGVTTGPIRVAVLVCGPAPMVAEVTTKSRRLTKNMGVIFDVHEETFAF